MLLLYHTFYKKEYEFYTRIQNNKGDKSNE